MWPVVHCLGVGAIQADGAVRVGSRQRCDEPSAGQVRQAVAAAIQAFGRSGVPGGWRRSLASI